MWLCEANPYHKKYQRIKNVDSLQLKSHLPKGSEIRRHIFDTEHGDPRKGDEKNS